MLFKDVIGQQEVAQQLVEMVAHNRLSHALLFLGPEGSGALPLALAFAQYVSLVNDVKAATTASDGGLFGAPEPVPFVMPQTIEAADELVAKHPGFSKTSAFVHPDIHFSYPVIPAKSGDKPTSTDYIAQWRSFLAEQPYNSAFDWLQFIGADNKQGNITAEECNEIIRKLSLKSFESPYKILVMWRPEYLGNVGNKLLKLIEEPPANTLFILVAESEESILPTILSRTQLVKVHRPMPGAIAQALIQQYGADPNNAMQISNLCEQNIRVALQLWQHPTDDQLALTKNILGAILRDGPVATVKWVEEVAKIGRERQKQWLKYFTHLLELGLRQQVDPNGQYPIAQHEADLVKYFSQKLSYEQMEAIVAETDKMAYYIERNANAKIQFHAFSIRLYHIIAHNTVFLAHP